MWKHWEQHQHSSQLVAGLSKVVDEVQIFVLAGRVPQNLRMRELLAVTATRTEEAETALR